MRELLAAARAEANSYLLSRSPRQYVGDVVFVVLLLGVLLFATFDGVLGLIYRESATHPVLAVGLITVSVLLIALLFGMLYYQIKKSNWALMNTQDVPCCTNQCYQADEDIFLIRDANGNSVVLHESDLENE
jgi:hypothetical protein